MAQSLRIEDQPDRLSPRARKCLKACSITTLDELSRRTTVQMRLQIPSPSRRELEEFRKLLSTYGMAFADEEPGPDPIPELAASIGVPEERVRRLRSLFQRYEHLARRRANLERQLKRAEEALEEVHRAGGSLMVEIGGASNEWTIRARQLALDTYHERQATRKTRRRGL